MRFRNRIDAGQRLAAQLTKYSGRSDVIVLLPHRMVPSGSFITSPLGGRVRPQKGVRHGSTGSGKGHHARARAD
jgi:hypothetical protein